MQNVLSDFTSFYSQDRDGRLELIEEHEEPYPPWFADSSNLREVKSAMAAVRFHDGGFQQGIDLRIPSTSCLWGIEVPPGVVLNRGGTSGIASLFHVRVPLGESFLWLEAAMTCFAEEGSLQAWSNSPRSTDWQFPPDATNGGDYGDFAPVPLGLSGTLASTAYGPAVVREWHTRMCLTLAEHILAHGFVPMVTDFSNFIPMLNTAWDWFRDYLQIHPDAQA